ncbi:MAG: hypothetical protein CSA44_01075 [Gammaproteobacteria bacterium]|nr:MAG: hypothetical protein CSA44_01075 [Gammaproteobacteria bacterium]
MADTKTDPRCDPNARVVGEPLPCQLPIRPIYPVRYSLTQERIEATLSAQTTPMPTGIDDSNYDLRRLRQGYFYILAEFTQVGESTDSKKRWLVFDYYVSADDDNGKMADSEPRYGTRYSFKKYEWEDGTARGKWVLDNRKTYPYAFVHPQVSIIHYAYSERRWPAAMFELMESTPAARTKIMQKVNLLSGDPKQAFPFTELHQRVADFQPENRQKDTADSYTRRTGLGFNEKHVVKSTNELATVVAVHDPIGNIADVSCYHEYIWNNDLQEQQKHLYAITTAKAVKQIEHTFTTDPGDKEGWFSNGYPIDQDLQPKLKEFARQKDLFQKTQEIDNIVKVHNTMLEETGNYTLHEQLQQTLSNAVQFASAIEDKKDVAEYAAFLYRGGMQQMGVSFPGMQKQALALNKDKPYGKYLATILKLSAQVAKIYGDTVKNIGLKRLELELMIESVSAAQMYRWGRVDFRDASIAYEEFLAAFHLKHVKYRGSLARAGEILQAQVDGFLQQRVRFDQAAAKLNQLPNTRASAQSFIDISLIIPQGQTEVVAAQHHLNLTEKAGIFLAASSLVQTLTGLEEKPDNPLNHPMLQLTGDLMGLVAAFEHTTIVEKAERKLVERAATSLGKLFENEKLLTQKFEHLFQGSGSLNRALAFVGYGANLIAIGVAIGQGIKSHRRGDRMGVTSAALGGMAEVAFLAASFFWTTPLIVAGALLVVGAIIYGWLMDNDYEAWTRMGFWGNSGKYWGKDRKKHADILEDTKVLANPAHSNYETVKKHFEQEMQAFYDLVWGIEIRNSTQGDKILRLYCPAFTGADCLNQLQLTWQTQTVWAGPGSGGISTNDLDAAKIARKWLFNGWVELDFSQALPQGLGTQGAKLSWTKTEALLTVSYPRHRSSKPFKNSKTFNSAAEI